MLCKHQLLGLTGQERSALRQGQDLEDANGIKIMSANLVLQNETDPVLWRGPVVAGAIQQFYSQCNWGDLDYLLIDMPPGTGDVALTVFQSLPVEGVVIVSSPQDLVQIGCGQGSAHGRNDACTCTWFD